MGYQVFPQPSGAADYENLGVEITNGATATADSFISTDGLYNVTTTVTAGIYQAFSNTSNAVLQFGNSSYTVFPQTSGGTLIPVTTTLTSFSARVPMGWNQTIGSFFTGTTTVRINTAFIPEDSRPIIFAGGYDTANQTQISYSTNGTSFTGRIIGANTGSAAIGRLAWHDGTNYYAILGAGISNLWWSTDGGVNWTTRVNLGLLNINVNQTAGAYYDTVLGRHYFNDQTANPRPTWTSTNGLNWSTITNGHTSNEIGGITRLGNFLFAYGGDSGSGGRLTISTNGTTWNNATLVNTTSVGFIADIGFNSTAGVYVFVTERGGINMSTDALNWHPQVLPNLSGTWNPGYSGVAYGDGYWVAAGARTSLTGSVAISTDGISWTNVGNTTGVLTTANTLEFFIGGSYYATGRSNKWLWYRARQIGGGSQWNQNNGIDSDARDGNRHNSVLGSPKVGFRAILSRFKQSRDIR